MSAENLTSLSPLEIKKKQFSTAFRGFDVKEVETFLEMITLEMEGLIIKKNSLKEALEKKEREFSEIKEREDSMRKTLEGLQQLLEEERKRAEEKGRQIVREAELKAAEILQGAREEEAALKNGIDHLKRIRREFLAKVGSLVDSYKKILDQDQKVIEEELRIDSDVRMI
ncbi:MAG: DivIVA domain-containing protein [Deltaproteobacteria bacterium]|nr:DivIVA domain-containing protein [Deltaproteobacteria bacterium]